MIDPPESCSPASPVSPADCDLENMAAEYEQAIRNYERYYSQQQASRNPQSPYLPGYPTGYGYSALNDAYAQAVMGYEQTLQSLEQAVAGFNAAMPQIHGLKGTARERYAGEWKVYLQGITDTNRELIESLEEAIGKVSEALT